MISTASGMATFDLLMTPEDVPESLKKKARTSPLSHRGMAIQLGRANDINSAAHSNSFLPMMSGQHETLTPQPGCLKWPMYSVPTVTVPELAPPGGSIVEVFPPIPQRMRIEDWDERTREERLHSVLAKLSELHDIMVAVTRVITPKDFQNRMHLYKGALYGLSPAANPRAQFSHVTRYRGCFWPARRLIQVVAWHRQPCLASSPRKLY